RFGTNGFRHWGPVKTIVFSSNGKYLFSSSNDRTVRIWDLDSKTEKARYTFPDIILDLALSPNDELLAVCSGPGVWVRNWTREEDQRLFAKAEVISVGPPAPIRESITKVTFSQDGKLLAWADQAGAVHAANLTTGKELFHKNGRPWFKAGPWGIVCFS